MQQYLNLLQEILDKGTWKNPARENMPRTLSLFGAQYRCKLSDGFPLLTTKYVSFKNVATELLWFLRGGGNIHYLLNNDCNIWNQDAYRYYLEVCKKNDIAVATEFTIERFIEETKKQTPPFNDTLRNLGYHYGDCPLGYELWRNFAGYDQTKTLIQGLKAQPEGRRHLLTAYDPNYTNFALAPCHIMAQFNCREIDYEDRVKLFYKNANYHGVVLMDSQSLDEYLIPKYYLDCQLYQRSADVFLGVPYNTASYALLTNILAEICGMIPGDLIHTFGDVHIYENHMAQVDEQLSRTPTELPTLHILNDISIDVSFDDLINCIEPHWFSLYNYNPQPSIKAKLSTGLI